MRILFSIPTGLQLVSFFIFWRRLRKRREGNRVLRFTETLCFAAALPRVTPECEARCEHPFGYRNKGSEKVQE
jgi:hypothetical protein